MIVDSPPPDSITILDLGQSPVKVIGTVANVPGSGVDVLTRIVTARLGPELGQHIVVDNRIDSRPGAGTAYGMETGRTAMPDGHTLISAATASLAIAPLIYRKNPQSILDDYELISRFAITPNLLVVTPSLPLQNVADLIAWSKTQPQVKMSSGGSGSQNHLAGMLLTTMGKFPALHAPYRGSTAPLAAVMNGEAQWTITPAPSVCPLVKSGRLRALGHSLPQRASNTALTLIGIMFNPAEPPSGHVILAFEGDIAIKLTVECLEVALSDLLPKT